MKGDEQKREDDLRKHGEVYDPRASGGDDGDDEDDELDTREPDSGDATGEGGVPSAAGDDAHVPE